MRETQAQTSLRIRTVLLERIVSKLATKKINFLASLCSGGDLFESRFVGNPEDRFSSEEAHMMCSRQRRKIYPFLKCEITIKRPDYLRTVKTPEDRFSHDEAHMMCSRQRRKIYPFKNVK